VAGWVRDHCDGCLDHHDGRDVAQATPGRRESSSSQHPPQKKSPHRIRRTASPTPPRSPASALSAAAAVRALISCITLSACDRSSRPFRNARSVNSPGRAGRAPASITARSTRRQQTGPPWHCSSITSSRVYDLWGAGGGWGWGWDRVGCYEAGVVLCLRFNAESKLRRAPQLRRRQ